MIIRIRDDRIAVPVRALHAVFRRRQRRAFASSSSSTNSVKARDEALYGGLKSFSMLTSELPTDHHAARDMTTKPLWHAWQLLTAGAVPVGLWLWLEHVEGKAKERLRILTDTDGAENGNGNGGENVEIDDAPTETEREAPIRSDTPTSLAALEAFERRLARIERQLDRENNNVTEKS